LKFPAIKSDELFRVLIFETCEKDFVCEYELEKTKKKTIVEIKHSNLRRGSFIVPWVAKNSKGLQSKNFFIKNL
jgi:hypothetical protein